MNNLVPVHYMYYDNDGLSGMFIKVDNLELASITALKSEMDIQKFDLNRGLHVDGELIPWDGFLACQEGVFAWDDEAKDYIYIGKITRQERVKYVLFKKGFNFSFLDNMGIEFEQGNRLILDGQYITYHENNPIAMLAIHKYGHLPVVIPYDKEIVNISDYDMAIIE